MQCGSKETKMHYLYCTDKEFTHTREKYLRLLIKQLKALNTYPGITTAICKILRHGYKTDWIQDIANVDGEHSILLQAVNLQQQLGNHSLPLGYTTSLWEQCQNKWILTSQSNNYCGDWAKDVIITLQTYTYSIWKERNNILHQHAEKSIRVKTKQALQERIALLYNHGRANLTNHELQYFKLPVDQRQKRE